MTIVMPLFIVALLCANLIVMVVILGNQRISSPRCGACSAGISGSGVESCSVCGGRFIEVGIASGSVIRPPKRVVLCFGGLVVSLALIPFLLILNTSLESFVQNRGNWRQSEIVMLGVVPFDGSGGHMWTRRVEIAGQQVRTQQNDPAEVLEASIVVSFRDGDELIGTPLEREVFNPSAGQEKPELSAPFSLEECRKWILQQGVFPAEMGQGKLDDAASCIIDNIDAAFLGPNWGETSVLVVRTPFTLVGPDRNNVPIPLPLWQLVMIRGALAFGIAVIVICVQVAILRHTRTVEVATA